MLWIIVSGALHNFNMYALGAFVSPFLVRFHHMTFVSAGWVAACVYGFSGIGGLTIGGWLADRLYAKRVDGRLIVGTAAIVICTPLMFLGLGRPAGDVLGFALLMGLGVGVMFAYYSTVYSTIHDVVEPSLRGTAMALYFFAMYVLGASMGPVGTGLASDYFTFQKASAAGAVAPLPFGADHDGGAAQPGRRVEGLQPEGARAVPRRRTAPGDVHRADSRGGAGRRAVRGVADGEEGRGEAAERG